MDSGSPSYPSLAWNSAAQRDIRGQQECLLALASTQHFLPPHHTRACSVTVHSASLLENSNCHYHRGSRAEIFIFLGKGCLFIMAKCQVYSLTRCLHRIIFRRTGNKSFIANQRQVKQREKKNVMQPSSNWNLFKSKAENCFGCKLIIFSLEAPNLDPLQSW